MIGHWPSSFLCVFGSGRRWGRLLFQRNEPSSLEMRSVNTQKKMSPTSSHLDWTCLLSKGFIILDKEQTFPGRHCTVGIGYFVYDRVQVSGHTPLQSVIYDLEGFTTQSCTVIDHWSPEWARWRYLACSGLCTVSPLKSLFFIPYNKSFTQQACSVKMAEHWPYYFLCVFIHLISRLHGSFPQNSSS